MDKVYNKIYDIAIIGGGPAGYSAALYGARAGYDTLVIEKMSAGGQMVLTGDIDNYPGFEDGIDGFTLGMKMQKGAERFGAKTVFGEVISVNLEEEPKRLVTDDGEILAKNVIIAVGAYPKELGLEGEREFTGRGIHYCAHCDGRFYKDKVVAVIGGGNSAAEDALYLSRLARKVYLIHRRGELRAEKLYRESLESTDNVEFVWNSTAESILASDRVTGIRIKNRESGKESELEVDGIFVSIGRKPATEFLKGIRLDKNGYIIAGEDTQTSVPGVFAAGDVRTKPLRQVATAVSDGAVAIQFVRGCEQSLHRK